MSQYKKREQLGQNYQLRGNGNNSSNAQSIMENMINDQSKEEVEYHNNNNNYYSIEGQIAQYAESRIVSGNSSNVNYPNKSNAFQQLSSQQSSSSITQPINLSNTNNHHQSRTSTQPYKRHHHQQRTNKLQVISGDSQTSVNNTNRQSSVNNNHNNKSASINRGGIRVVSRGSTVEKREESCSVEKSDGEGLLKINSGDGKQNSREGLAGMFGISCKVRSPFTEAQQINELTIPPYNNMSAASSISSQLQMHNNKPISTQRLTTQTSLYKQLRELMQKQVMVSRKMYEKKCIEEAQSISIIYQGQIETLQRVLAENQTMMEQQERKVQRLEEKCAKHEGRIAAYAQRLQSINKYIQSTNRFALQRLSQTQLKLTLLLTDFRKPQLSPSFQHHSCSHFASKLQHLQQIFTTVLSQTIMKYRNIEFEIKSQIKDVMKRYEYFQERIYEMELMKHLGKENQIQNYKLREKVENIKGQLEGLQERNQQCYKIRTQYHTSNAITYDGTSINDIQQFNHLKTTLYKLQAQVEFWQKNQNEMFETINKLEVDKYRLANRVNELSQEVEKAKVKGENQMMKASHMKVQKEQNMQEQQQRTHHTLQSVKKHQQSPQRYQFSSDKQSLYVNSQQKQTLETNKQLQRLHEIIDQYECKIQQLHNAIEQLQQQNGKLLNELNKKVLEQKRQSLGMDQSTVMKLNHLLQEKQSHMLRLEFVIEEKDIQLQQIDSRLQQASSKLFQAATHLQYANRQRDQLNQALQMTEHIFDEQIQKFKSTIQRLQQENQQLLSQLNQLRVSSSNKGSGQQFVQKQPTSAAVLLSLGKSKSNQQQQSKRIIVNQSNNMLYREVQSPTNSYTSQNQYQQHKYHQHMPQNDEFSYPQQQQNYRSYSYSMQDSIGDSKRTNSKNSTQRNIQGYNQHSSAYVYSKQINSSLNSNSNNANLNRLQQAITDGKYNHPIDCILDSDGRLVVSPTGRYLIDKNYSTFQLSPQQLSSACKLKLINLIDENNNNQQQQQQQGEHYIF